MTAWLDRLAGATGNLDRTPAAHRARQSDAVPAWLAAMLYLASLA